MNKVTVKIDNADVEFGSLGRAFRVDCAKRVREQRERAFGKIVDNLSADPMVAMSRAHVAIDAFSSTVIISDNEVNSWLLTPEGFAFAFESSARRASPDITTSKAMELLEDVTEEDYVTLRDFWGDALTGGFYAEKVKEFTRRMEVSIEEELAKYRKDTKED